MRENALHILLLCILGAYSIEKFATYSVMMLAEPILKIVLKIEFVWVAYAKFANKQTEFV